MNTEEMNTERKLQHHEVECERRHGALIAEITKIRGKIEAMQEWQEHTKKEAQRMVDAVEFIRSKVMWMLGGLAGLSAIMPFVPGLF